MSNSTNSLAPRGITRAHPFADHPIAQLARERILVLDGAMGTVIQTLGLGEDDFRADRFEHHSARPRRQQRPARPHPARRDARHPPRLLPARVPTSSRRTRSRAPASRRATTARTDVIHDMNVAAARVAREAADEAHGRDGRPRFVAGARRADQHDAVDVAARRGPRLPVDHLRRPRRRLRGTDRRVDRGRRRPPADRDDLRHAERQGGHRGGTSRARPRRHAAAAHDLGHDHRPFRSHVVGPDSGGVLAVDPPRPTAHGRPELRARRRGDAAPHRGDLGRRRHVAVRVPERRTPERTRRLRRRPRDDRRRSSSSSPKPGWSTSSAAAVAPRRRTSRPSPSPSSGSRHASCRPARRGSNCRASSRST